MVESVSSINSATAVAAASSVEKVQEEEKKETQTTKTTDKVTKTEEKSTEVKETTMDRYRVQRLVMEYLEKMEKQYEDSPWVKDQIDMWLATFDVDKFMVKYPELYTEMDLSSIMYNETVNFV